MPRYSACETGRTQVALLLLWSRGRGTGHGRPRARNLEVSTNARSLLLTGVEAQTVHLAWPRWLALRRSAMRARPRRLAVRRAAMRARARRLALRRALRKPRSDGAHGAKAHAAGEDIAAVETTVVTATGTSARAREG